MSASPDHPTAEPPSCAAVALAMTGATVPVAVVLTLAAQLHGAFLAVFLVTLLIVGLSGGLSFLWIREKLSAPRVVGAGFATGAIVPTFGVLSGARDGLDWTDLLVIAGYGFVGIAGSLIAWSLLVWQKRDLRAQEFLAAASLGTVIALTLLL